MDLPVALALLGLVAAATVLGLVWRGTTGRARHVRTGEAVAIEGVELGSSATLLQFSSSVCAPCAATARVLHRVADPAAGIRHVELDVAERPELAARFSVLQTPTTLILDAAGVVRARIGGAARPG